MTMVTLSTDLTQLMSIRHPIVLAPMAGVSHASLVSAVANAGGLGLLACGYSAEPEWVRKQLRVASASVENEEGAIGVGFITWALKGKEELLDAALEMNVAAIWFSFGDYSPYIDTIRARSPKTKIIVQVQTVAQAITAVEGYGIDILVAQGSESGGHGRKNNGSVFSLVPEIMDATAGRVPVLAAGGVTDGRHLASAIMLGASGVVVGTRLCATPESAMHPKAKAKLLETTDGGVSTVRATVFDQLRRLEWPPEYDFRTLRNEVTDTIESGLTPASWQTAYDHAVKQQDYSVLPVPAGQGVGMVRHISPAREVIGRMMDDAKLCLDVGAAMVDSRRTHIKSSL